MPKQPGVYKMINENGDIIYVGKAKNLPNRVNQYTIESNLSNRIKRMVAQVRAVAYIETPTEMEALILECNLIKSLRPFF